MSADNVEHTGLDQLAQQARGQSTVRLEPSLQPRAVAATANGSSGTPSPAPRTSCCFDCRTALWLSVFAYIGVTIRLCCTYMEVRLLEWGSGTVAEGFGDGFLLSNVLGSAIMGALHGRADIFTRRLGPGAFVGITVGMCGSITTFSSWNQRASMRFVEGKWAEALLLLFLMHAACVFSFAACKTDLSQKRANRSQKAPSLPSDTAGDKPVRRDELDTALQQAATSSGSGEGGGNVGTRAQGPETLASKSQAPESSEPGAQPRNSSLLDRLSLTSRTPSDIAVEVARLMREVPPRFWILSVMFLGFLLVSITLSTLGATNLLEGDTFTKGCAAVSVAPLGALLRRQLSAMTKHISARAKKQSGGKDPWFAGFNSLPCNVLGSIVVSALACIRTEVDKGTLAYAWYGALQVGFCGSLTTVSSFVAELSMLKTKRQRVMYSMLTFCLSQICMLAINGGCRLSN